jgi:hypothetical protein
MLTQQGLSCNGEPTSGTPGPSLAGFPYSRRIGRRIQL